MCVCYCGACGVCGSKRGGACVHSWTHLWTKQRVGTSKNDNEPPDPCARGLRFHFSAISPFRLPISPSYSHLISHFDVVPVLVPVLVPVIGSFCHFSRTKGTVAGLAGHANHRQKIHLLDKVMKENRALKKENAVLQTKVVHTRRPAGGAGKKD